VKNEKFKVFHKIWSHQHNFLYGILIQIKGVEKLNKERRSLQRLCMAMVF